MVGASAGSFSNGNGTFSSGNGNNGSIDPALQGLSHSQLQVWQSIIVIKLLISSPNLLFEEVMNHKLGNFKLKSGRLFIGIVT